MVFEDKPVTSKALASTDSRKTQTYFIKQSSVICFSKDSYEVYTERLD